MLGAIFSMRGESPFPLIFRLTEAKGSGWDVVRQATMAHGCAVLWRWCGFV